jgi:calcium-dependent protein kinase
VSHGAKNLISKMLTFDPRERITAKEALLDPWIQEFAKIKFEDAKPLNIESLKKLKDFNSKRKLHGAIF